MTQYLDFIGYSDAFTFSILEALIILGRKPSLKKQKDLFSPFSCNATILRLSFFFSISASFLFAHDRPVLTYPYPDFQYAELFDNIDVSREDSVDWDKFAAHMLLEYYEKDDRMKSTQLPQWKDLKNLPGYASLPLQKCCDFPKL